jgi:ribonuclease G
MTRKRVRESLERILCEPCQYCDGKGFVKSPTTICFEIFLELRRIALAKKNCRIMITANPQVADLIYDDEREGMEEIERENGFKVIVKADRSFHQEYFEVATL